MARGHWKQKKAKSAGDSERHFCRRLAERYGLTVTSAEYRALGEDIRNGRGSPLFRESLTRTHWLIRVKGVEVRAVYDKTTKALATALPRETIARDSDGTRSAETERLRSLRTA